MARFTFFRQDAQQSSDVFDDTLAAGATLESAAVTAEDDFNSLRSQMQRAIGIANWYDALTAPVTFEGGAIRGIQPLNQDLHDLERKRVLRTVCSLVDVTVTAAQNFEILQLGELPANTTIAVGAVTTLGTVAADLSVGFGAHSLVEVAGSHALAPKNLGEVFDGATRDPILSSGRTVYALLQSENAADGFTATGTTPNRLQVSFVRINATGDDLEAVPVADIENAVVNLCFNERVGLEDLNEQDFLRGAISDVPSGSVVTRQVAYDNQGVTPVDLTTNATLDLEGAGLVWEIRDDLEARLFAVVEGSAGGTSEVQIAAAVDTFNVDAVDNDFANGATFGTVGTGIAIAENAGIIERAADLTIRATGVGELFFDDSNRGASTFSVPLKLADTSQEWTDFETAFGEVSLLNAITQAANVVQNSQKTSARLTANANADTDVGGTAGGANLDAQIHDLSGGDFVSDHDVYLNGQILRGGADAAANFDYYPGTSLALGQLRFEFNLKFSPGQPDVLTVISRA